MSLSRHLLTVLATSDFTIPAHVWVAGWNAREQTHGSAEKINRALLKHVDISTSLTYSLHMKNFEWDNKKRKLNLDKHGIDFIDAIEIFDDPDRIEFESSRNGEKRIQTMGKVNNIVLFLVYTSRGKKKRIISVRRASKNERKVYDEA